MKRLRKALTDLFGVILKRGARTAGQKIACGAIHVDGIALVGYTDRQAAAKAIAGDTRLKEKGAVPTELQVPPPKGTFRSDYPFLAKELRSR